MGRESVCPGPALNRTWCLSIRKPLQQLALAVVIATAAGAAVAETRYVDSAACPATGSGSQGDPFCTIQEAICVAVSGDTVSVAPGTYPEAIRMRPGVVVSSQGGPQVTTIDGAGQPCTSKTTGSGQVAYCTKQAGNQCSVVTFASGHTSSSVIEGFTITGGGGLQQTSIVAGGGIFVFSSPTIRDNIIENNFLNPTLDNLGGAGIYVSVGQPIITGNVIRGNTAIPNAGRKSSITTGYGAGIFIGFNAAPTITANLISNNLAGDPALSYSLGGGAGISVISGPAGTPETVIDGNALVGNQADTFGGGLSLATVTGSISHIVITNNVIDGNNSGLRGGGIYTYFTYNSTINNTVVNNESVTGGGIFSGVSDVSHPVVFTNNVIDGNTLFGTGTNGGGLYTKDLNSDPLFDPLIEHNDFWGNEKNNLAGDFTDASTIGVDGNISSDPLFEDRANGNFELGAGSPAIDQALSSVAPPFDQLGNPRGVDGDGSVDSPVLGDVDIGALETGGGCAASTEVCDGLDNNCDSLVDEGFPDTDLDLVADCVDVDDDNDGVEDTGDNCSLIVNPAQLDRDADGAGDLCDPDADNDGIANLSDCSPLDPVFNLPPATSPTVAFAAGNPDRLEWLQDPGARVYALYSWDFAANGGFQRTESCQGAADPQLSVSVAGDPASGEIRGFLVSSLNACGEGAAGSDSLGTPRAVVGGCADEFSDGDGDGYADLTDNCPSQANTSQLDTDSDGYGDPCDACPDLVDEDADLDNFCNAFDNCPSVANPGQQDLDSDGQGDACDTDDDADGVVDAEDPAPLNPGVCGDSDLDSCDDCAVGLDGLGPGVDSQPGHDGPDMDGDGLCDAGDADADGDGTDDSIDNCLMLANDQANADGDAQGDACDPDDDNDGFEDALDAAALDPNICEDADADGCDDCSVGVDGFGPEADNNPANDGDDLDGDGACDLGDADDDNDGVDDASDLDPLDPQSCADTDADTCDDCSVGVDGLGPLADGNPSQDGADLDGDGLCDAGDEDDDGDGYPDLSDNCPLLINDQANTDGDQQGDACDADDDNDGVADGLDTAALDPTVCGDSDSDTCEDCSIGVDGFGSGIDSQPMNDGPDLDGDGLCDAGDTDDDGDGYGDLSDNCPLIANDQTDTDNDLQGDACDDDDDNDTVPDVDDNCRLVANLAQLDRDLDGFGNVCDQDADGDSTENALDCSPLDPVYNALPPAIAGSVGFEDAAGNVLAWDASAVGRLYAVYTWDFATSGGFNRVDSCLQGASPATSADVAGVPEPGTMRGFLVTAINACGEGSGGQDSSLVERTLAGGCFSASQDTDLDAYPDVTDNCPLVSNVDQADSDQDGVGDACATP